MSIIHYCGHMVSGTQAKGDRFTNEDCPRVFQELQAVVLNSQVSAAYGSLACGADILIAEAVHQAHGELHIFLPFDRECFIEVSVRPGGAEWVPRFESLLAVASSVATLSAGPFDGNAQVFNQCTKTAMDAAQQMAGNTHRVFQLCVWDQEESARSAGTQRDVEEWAKRGMESVHIHPSLGRPKLGR